MRGFMGLGAQTTTVHVWRPYKVGNTRGTSIWAQYDHAAHVLHYYCKHAGTRKGFRRILRMLQKGGFSPTELEDLYEN
jgi:hypothetical protein